MSFRIINLISPRSIIIIKCEFSVITESGGHKRVWEGPGIVTMKAKANFAEMEIIAATFFSPFFATIWGQRFVSWVTVGSDLSGFKKFASRFLIKYFSGWSSGDFREFRTIPLPLYFCFLTSSLSFLASRWFYQSPPRKARWPEKCISKCEF